MKDHTLQSVIQSVVQDVFGPGWGSVVPKHMCLTSYRSTCFPDPSSFLHPIYCLSGIRIGRQWPPASQRDLPTPVL